MTTVGYVGLGAMGRALARRLIEPFGVTVWDLAPAAVEALAAEGAAAAASLAELAAACDVVVLCLPTSDVVEIALFGGGGLAPHLQTGTLVIDQTSGIPARTRGFAERLAAQGVSFVDAPVAGGVPSALAGQITIMASGPADALELARPVLEAISPRLYKCGDEVGAGQATKAINNLVNTGYRMAALELLGLGRRLGIAAANLTGAFNDGPARSFVTQRLLPAVVEGRSSSDFALGLMCKDVNQAADLALAHGLAMPVSDAARALMTTAWRLLGPESRLDDLVPFMERVTGAQFRGDAVGSGLDADVGLVVAAMAAANRAIIAEGATLARRAGLDPALFAAVMAAGSGASVQGDRLAAGQATSSGGEAGALDALCQRGGALGVPLALTNQIRAVELAARQEPGSVE